MKKLILLIAIGVSLVAKLPAQAEHARGGGGVSLCRNTELDLSGYYSLDYLFYVKVEENESVPVKDFQEYMTRLTLHLDNTIPSLAKRLKYFNQTYLKKSATEKLSWQGGGGIIPLNESYQRELPQGCSKPAYAVVWKNGPVEGSNNYIYNTKLIAALREKPEQETFNAVHEFLRYALGPTPVEVETIKDLNGYFHSPDFFSHGEDLVQISLERLGMGLLKTRSQELAELRANQEEALRQKRLQQAESDRMEVDKEHYTIALHLFSEAERAYSAGNYEFDLRKAREAAGVPVASDSYRDKMQSLRSDLLSLELRFNKQRFFKKLKEDVNAAVK